MFGSIGLLLSTITSSSSHQKFQIFHAKTQIIKLATNAKEEMSNKGNKEAEARVKGKSEDKRKVIIVLEKACLEAVKTKKVRL